MLKNKYISYRFIKDTECSAQLKNEVPDHLLQLPCYLLNLISIELATNSNSNLDFELFK